MKKKQSLNITLAIFLGLVLGIVFGLFMPGRYEFLLPVIELLSGVYMNALQETQEIIGHMRHWVRACRRFQQEKGVVTVL